MSGESGIPLVRQRIDRTESAREHNNLRESVYSLQSRMGLLEQPPVPHRKEPQGFEPIVFEDGIGLAVGYVHFMQTRRFTATADEQEAIEICPELGGIALNSGTPPREFLDTGDWEAWCITEEVEPDHRARIEFSGLGTGPGNLAVNEKAFRLVSFSVQVAGDDDEFISASVIEQHKTHLDVPIEMHQFKARKTGDNTIVIQGGTALWPKGLSDPIVFENVKIGDSSTFEITQAGSIWLAFSVNTSQQSTSSATLGSAGTVYLTMYKISYCVSNGFSFRTAAPAAGTDANDVFVGAGDIVWYEICQVELDGGQVVVTNQCIDAPIYLPEIVDGQLS